MCKHVFVEKAGSDPERLWRRQQAAKKQKEHRQRMERRRERKIYKRCRFCRRFWTKGVCGMNVALACARLARSSFVMKSQINLANSRSVRNVQLEEVVVMHRYRPSPGEGFIRHGTVAASYKAI